jgi:signal transduction histidine kinase
MSRNHQGTGLGLSLIKSMVDLHGGSVDIQSEVGTGTTVTVRFPAERIVQERKERFQTDKAKVAGF